MKSHVPHLPAHRHRVAAFAMQLFGHYRHSTSLEVVAVDSMRTPSESMSTYFAQRYVASLLAATSLMGPHEALSGAIAPLTPSTSEFHASLLKGEATVCKDYVKRLNQMIFVRELRPTRSGWINNPHCDRGESGAPKGFRLLKREPLSIDELLRLQPSVFAFLDSPTGTPASIPVPSTVHATLPYPPGSAQFRQWTAINARDHYFFYRFEPRVDIDNNGAPDDVVVWKETGGPCGELDNGGEPRILRTDLLVLDRAGRLDMEKTRSLVGHPKGEVLALRSTEDPAHPDEVRATRFRTIGNNFGVLEYEGVTYFDTFYAEGGDLENRRDGTPNYLETLAVLLHKGGKTQLVCEILIR
jgi:hypothetical protein